MDNSFIEEKGVQKNLIHIQDEFLKFETSYKASQNLFMNIKKLTQNIKKSRLENINEAMYEVANNLLDLSTRYVKSKVELNKISSETVYDTIVMENMLYIIEKDKLNVKQVEVKIGIILSLMKEYRIAPKNKISKLEMMLEETNLNKENVVFIPSYEKVVIDRTDLALFKIMLNFIECTGAVLVLGILSSKKVLNWLLSLGTQKQDKVVLNLEEVITGTGIEPHQLSIQFNEYVFDLIGVMGRTIALILLLLIIFKVLLNLLYVTSPREIREYILNNTKLYQDIIEIETQEEEVVVEKLKLVRSKEIIESIKLMEEYSNSVIVNYLYNSLKGLDITEVLTLEQNYLIVLTEVVYNLINRYHLENKEYLIEVLNARENNIKLNSDLLKLNILVTRLGIQ